MNLIFTNGSPQANVCNMHVVRPADKIPRDLKNVIIDENGQELEVQGWLDSIVSTSVI